MTRALLDTGDAEQARPHAERAVELARADDVSPSDRGLAEEMLAEVAWALGEHDHALRTARAALQSFTDAPDDYAASVVRVRMWLDSREAS